MMMQDGGATSTYARARAVSTVGVGNGSRLLAQMVARQPRMHVSPYTLEARSFYAANGFDRLLTGYSLVRS